MGKKSKHNSKTNKPKKTDKEPEKKDVKVPERDDVKEPEKIVLKKDHKFWYNKPVTDFGDFNAISHEIEDLTKREVYSKTEELKLPSGFVWELFDFADNETMNEVLDFLDKHYLVDVTNKFSINYTKEFLKWSIGNNGFLLGIRASKPDATTYICGTVGVIYRDVTVFDKTTKMAEVNYLCTHRDLRGKHMAGVLIDEAVRRICGTGITHGIFTTEKLIPTPITKIRYYHRPLNFLKLHKLGFISLGDDKLDEKLSHFEITEKVSSQCVSAEPKHYEDVYRLYKSAASTFNIYNNYTYEEFVYYMFENDFMKTYVYIEKDRVIDFGSFYSLPYNIKDSTEKIRACYLFLYSTNVLSADTNINNLLTCARDLKFDVFNATDVMWTRDALLITAKPGDESDNEDYKRIYELKFLKGSGKIHLNFFNWKSPKVEPSQICWMVF
jgi:glycylpeptide N-tetradecanoyltransferase